MNRLMRNFKYIFGWPGSPRIVPFIGYGTKERAFITGEIVEDFGLSKPAEGQSKWQNVKAMAKRYFGRDLVGIKVQATMGGQICETTTDQYGIFRCEFNFPHGNPDKSIWQKAKLKVLNASGGKNLSVHNPLRIDFPDETETEVMIIGSNPQFGVISDIDDTILISFATQKLMKLRLMLFNNAYTRMPFEGVSAFYRALQRGTGNGYFNPVFYVSNSEWNLYDLMYEFIHFNRIPKGPLLLREQKIRLLHFSKIRKVNRNHKEEAIRRIMEMYPEMKFILIGDSGQHDPEVYSKVTGQYPGRILSIYIRDLGIPENSAEIKVLSANLHSASKTEMILVKDTEAAAKHAISKGFISSAYLESVVQEKQEDLEKKDQPNKTLL